MSKIGKAKVVTFALIVAICSASIVASFFATVNLTVAQAGLAMAVLAAFALEGGQWEGPAATMAAWFGFLGAAITCILFTTGSGVFSWFSGLLMLGFAVMAGITTIDTDNHLY